MLKYKNVGSLKKKVKYGGVPKWSKGADCKSVAAGFVGSNPTPSTTKIKNGAGVAQSVEQPTCNRQVAGSSPIASSI